MFMVRQGVKILVFVQTYVALMIWVNVKQMCAVYKIMRFYGPS